MEAGGLRRLWAHVQILRMSCPGSRLQMFLHYGPKLRTISLEGNAGFVTEDRQACASTFARRCSPFCRM